MSTQPKGAARPLPDRPNLRHLKDQAKDLLKAGAAASLAHARFQIARLYGFASWPKLKAYASHCTSVAPCVTTSSAGRLFDSLTPMAFRGGLSPGCS